MKIFNILIVDYNENNRFTVKSVLSQPRVAIHEAKDGEEALACLLRNEIHLIILDIELPDYNGFDIAKIIKSKKDTKGIPIIFVTAIFKSEEYIEQGYQLGAVDYIMKPFDVTMLLTKVQHYITLHEEKYGLMEKLVIKTQELIDKNNELEVLQKKQEISESNWRLLSENVPYLVELYDTDLMKVFDNRKYVDDTLYIIHQYKQDEFEEQLKQTIEGKRSRSEIYTMDHQGKKCYFEVKSFLVDIDGVSHCMIIIGDDTHQHENEQNIMYLGFHDQLTGLRNRRFFRKYLENMDKADRLPISIIMGDVNGLKMINDSFGHLTGDELIKKAVNVMLKNIGKDSILARWGGDEFIALLPRVNENKVEQVLKNINQEIEKEKGDNKLPLSLALGDATREDVIFSFEEMIKEAEDKMHVNKMQSQLSCRSTIIESLKSAMFEKDYETDEHTNRISQMAMVMAKHLGLSQNDKDKLVILGELHDIGKIAIPTHVLNSMKPLTDLEWNSIKRHPETGFRICSSVPELASISDLVLSHHERWDGKGYPRGLKMTEIPLLARLICLLDAFDVMTHDRPYRGKKSPEWAMEEVARCSGSQFDPNLVKLFIKVYKETFDHDKSVQ